MHIDKYGMDEYHEIGNVNFHLSFCQNIIELTLKLLSVYTDRKKSGSHHIYDHCNFETDRRYVPAHRPFDFTVRVWNH